MRGATGRKRQPETSHLCKSEWPQFTAASIAIGHIAAAAAHWPLALALTHDHRPPVAIFAIFAEREALIPRHVRGQLPERLSGLPDCIRISSTNHFASQTSLNWIK